MYQNSRRLMLVFKDNQDYRKLPIPSLADTAGPGIHCHAWSCISCDGMTKDIRSRGKLLSNVHNHSHHSHIGGRVGSSPSSPDHPPTG